MKKINKKTKILGLLILFIGMMLQSQIYGQEWLSPKDLNPPTDLLAEVQDENDVNLFWTAPSTGDSTYLHWDNGINYTSYGNFIGPAIVDYAAKWDPDHIAAYDGWTITTMRFWVTSPMPTIKLKIWAGPEATEIYSQDLVQWNINNWTEITLDNPVTIDASTQLWAGLFIDMPVAGVVMGCDEGPAISGYGNMTRFNYGIWETASNLNWNIQIQVQEPALPTYLHWDNGENYTSIGNYIVPSEFDFATKWDPDHIAAYDGWTVTKMRFYLTNPTPTVKLKIWTGQEATEIYSQDVSSFAINDWTEVTLDSPVTIDASTQFWIGLNIDMPTTGAVMGADEGPAIDGYGNIYRQNGSTWYSDFDMNWNIQFQVEDLGSKAVDGLLGYNIYRNDEQINEDTWGGISYVDENLLNGTYNYYVTAIYDEGESDPSNIVEVVIDQPVIVYADSMALVDLYNNCNGPNWTTSNLWLEGPVSEWYGVTTTGTRVTGLMRQSANLTGDIPESIGDLTALEKLHLESNQITSIPESIGNLEALTEFWLGWTPITTIPESFGNLSNLVQLHLGLMEIGLGTLPDSFCNLESLEWLALGQAGLNSLPDNFGNLTSLEICFLWGNNLTELPSGIGGLESLIHLTLYNNQLTNLPESFGNMENLSHLDIIGNQLTSLPESFGNMSSMHKLKLGNNQLIQLPVNFGNMTNLSHLELLSNQLTSLPENFGNLESLDSVYLSHNSLNSLPESFGNLSDLNLLSLENNNLTELPASFGNLATVEEIYLNENQLEILPENFGNMPEIILLVLVYNNLTTLPESITELTSLKALYAGENQIESIPENIGNMENLQMLAMGFNNITEIPESIGNLSSLGSISLSHNQINALPETFGNLNADTVLLGDNNIHELPSSMFDKYYEYLWVQENALQFGSLEPFMDNGIWEFLYDPQAMIGNDTLIGIPNHATVSYTIEVTGSNNIYKWYKDGTLLPDQTSNTLYIENASYNDEGTYVLKVTNVTVPVLELISYDVKIEIVGQQFDLELGFQFISSAVDPADPDMTVVMADILNTNLDFVRNSAGQMLRKIGPVWVNGIGNWVVEEGYLVKMLAADSFTVCGAPVAPGTPIDVELGFQFVSYFPTAPMDALVAFETIVGDDLDFIRNSAGQMLRKIGPVWINGIGDAMPGEGYLVKMLAPGQIIYPEPVKLSGKTSITPSHLLFEGGNAAEPVYTMYIKGLELGDEVAAYNGDVILGSMTVTSDNVYNNALPVFSQLTNGQGYVAGETISLKVWSNDNVVVADFEMESVYNSYVSDVYPDNDGEFSVVNVTKDAMLSGELLVYPNPATDLINIASPSDIINVTIYNYVGQTVYSSNVNSSNVQINSNDFKAGIYIIRIQTCRGLETQKVSIK